MKNFLELEVDNYRFVPDSSRHFLYSRYDIVFGSLPEDVPPAETGRDVPTGEMGVEGFRVCCVDAGATGAALGAGLDAGATAPGDGLATVGFTSLASSFPISRITEIGVVKPFRRLISSG